MRLRDGLSLPILRFTVVVSLVASCAKEGSFRFNAPITVDQPAAFVQLPLSAAVYGRTRSPDLTDLRILDGRGDRVPFAVLAPRVAEPLSIEQQRDAVLYQLPERPAAGGAWQSPVEVTVQGDRISVTRRDGAAAGAKAPGRRSGGWLIDLGERKRNEPSPRGLRMQWSGPSEFTATFGFETSDDLSTWRNGGSGQLMALASAGGPLTQAAIKLPADPGRFVRLVWADPAVAPALVGAKVIADQEQSVALDPPAELVLTASPEPAGQVGSDGATQRVVHFDLGAVLPVVEIDLRLPPGTRIVPVRVEGRTGLDQPWGGLGSTVFYRLDRGAEVNPSPPMAIRTSVRYVRVIPDPRAAPLEAGRTKLVVHARLASLVFANQGQPPLVLLAGSTTEPSSALPIGILVPGLDDERPRFGRATLGEWHEVAAVARADESARKVAAMRPWLLWTVLLAGVAALGVMVWRLARGGHAGAGGGGA